MNRSSSVSPQRIKQTLSAPHHLKDDLPFSLDASPRLAGHITHFSAALVTSQVKYVTNVPASSHG
jgi:hypothetical protein